MKREEEERNKKYKYFKEGPKPQYRVKNDPPKDRIRKVKFKEADEDGAVEQ